MGNNKIQKIAEIANRYKKTLNKYGEESELAKEAKKSYEKLDSEDIKKAFLQFIGKYEFLDFGLFGIKMYQLEKMAVRSFDDEETKSNKIDKYNRLVDEWEKVEFELTDILGFREIKKVRFSVRAKSGRVYNLIVAKDAIYILDKSKSIADVKIDDYFKISHYSSLDQQVKNFEEGILECSDCGESIQKVEVAGTFYNQVFCGECWNNNGWKERAKRERYT